MLNNNNTNDGNTSQNQVSDEELQAMKIDDCNLILLTSYS